jgi:Mn-dependent DtxR family transcriptional regulator
VTVVTSSSSVTKHPKPTATTTQSKSSLGKTADLILNVLAEELSMNKDVVPRSKMMSVTGLAAKTLANAYTKLKQQEFIEMDAQSIRLTTAGKTLVADWVIQPKTNQDRHDDIKSKLKGKQITLFDLLQDGHTQSKNDVAVALHYEGKSTKAFQNLVAAMKSKGVVEYPTQDTVRLTDVCFPCGRD